MHKGLRRREEGRGRKKKERGWEGRRGGREERREVGGREEELLVVRVKEEGQVMWVLGVYQFSKHLHQISINVCRILCVWTKVRVSQTNRLVLVITGLGATVNMCLTGPNVCLVR